MVAQVNTALRKMAATEHRSLLQYEPVKSKPSYRPLNKQRIKGDQYERQAAELLTAAGAKVITKNYHCYHGEIDIICLHDNELVFVEVKYRKNAHFGSALDAVTKTKRLRLQQAAAHYCLHHSCDHAMRFDVIGFTGTNSPEWIRNAFC